MCSTCIFLDHVLLNAVQLLLVPSDGAVLKSNRNAKMGPAEARSIQESWNFVSFHIFQLCWLFTTSAIGRGCLFTKQNAPSEGDPDFVTKIKKCPKKEPGKDTNLVCCLIPRLCFCLDRLLFSCFNKTFPRLISPQQIYQLRANNSNYN